MRVSIRNLFVFQLKVSGRILQSVPESRVNMLQLIYIIQLKSEYLKYYNGE